jgi:nickel superoxide dismutase
MKLSRLLPATTVYAHCDIPCGVYSAEPARIAATAVVKIAEKMAALKDPMGNPDDHNDFVRMVLIKEREAQRAKDELLILWTDYFKPEHLEKYPKLHDMFWAAAKSASTAKRTTDVAAAKKLLDEVNLVADVFAQAEAAAHAAK